MRRQKIWCRCEYSETLAFAKKLLVGVYQERTPTQSVAARMRLLLGELYTIMIDSQCFSRHGPCHMDKIWSYYECYRRRRNLEICIAADS